MHVVTYYGTKPIAYCQIKHLKDLDMVTRDHNSELNLRTFSTVKPSWPDVHKVRLKYILLVLIILIGANSKFILSSKGEELEEV